jgi:hypothetical protein
MELLTQVAAVVGLGGLLSTFFGAIITYYFDRRKRSREVFLARLKVINEYFQKYYIPITKLSQECANALSNALESSTEDDIKYAFFQTAKLLRADYDWTVKGGGQVILRDYTAEAISLMLYEEAIAELPFTQLKVSILQKNIGKDELLVDSWSKIDDNEEVGEIFEEFKEWLSSSPESVKKTITCFKYFFEYLWYELNRIQRVWYTGKPPALSTSCEDYVKKIDHQSEQS